MTTSNTNYDPSVGTIYTPPVTDVASVTPSTETYDSGKSTLQSSETPSALINPLASTPLLPTPWVNLNNDNTFSINTPSISPKAGITPTDIYKMYAEKSSQIMDDMLEGWLANIELLKERVAEELRSPRYLAFLESIAPSTLAKKEAQAPSALDIAVRQSTEYQAWLSSLTSAERVEELRRGDALQQAMNLTVGLTSGINEQRQRIDNNDPSIGVSLPAMSASFFVGITFVGGSMAVEMARSVADAAQSLSASFTPMVTQIAATYDFRAELGLLGAVLALMTQVTLFGDVGQTTNKSTDQKTIDLQAARSFAKNVIQAVTSNEMTAFIMGLLVNKMEGSQIMTDERKDQIVHMIKAVLLAMALSLLYRVEVGFHKPETGWMTKEEFKGLLDGTIKVDTNDIKATLIALFQNELSFLSDKESHKLIDAFGDFLNTQPDLSVLQDPNKVFAGLFKSYAPQPLAA
jgi:hypothetical protein